MYSEFLYIGGHVAWDGLGMGMLHGELVLFYAPNRRPLQDAILS